jgi:sugar lactone lactonase YvrE
MRLLRVVLVLVAVSAALFLVLRALLGGGRRLEDRTGEPRLPGSALEKVADLDYPPGNVAVSSGGRVFFTFHPDGGPPLKVAELVGGRPVPYPDEAFQHERDGAPFFETVLSLRVDRQDRLWTLDHADYALGQPRLLAFDLATSRLVHQFDFPPEAAPFLSMLNDFQVDPRGERIYIADASPIRRAPAILVYDVAARRVRRLLDRHPSVQAKDFLIQAPGRDMVFFGFYTLRVPVDSIALDRRGEWLYYGPVNDDRLYRVRAADLNNESFTGEVLGALVESYAPKTLSDGLTTDELGNIYISDMEHSAVLALAPDRKLTTVVKDARLRWPDGFSFGPDGWLYVTCSSLQDVLFVGAAHMRAHAPYQIYRFQPGPAGAPGQ